MWNRVSSGEKVKMAKEGNDRDHNKQEIFEGVDTFLD